MNPKPGKHLLSQRCADRHWRATTPPTGHTCHNQALLAPLSDNNGAQQTGCRSDLQMRVAWRALHRSWRTGWIATLALIVATLLLYRVDLQIGQLPHSLGGAQRP
ncbi:hypothetical protein [Vulcanococcus sp.]|uniref:hypothetical protein n=1 Tax=Vulcanococcus sp. TaxID=2856995 RepID=UPI003F697778